MNQNHAFDGRPDPQLRPDALNDLIGSASRQIGTTPQRLKEQIDNGRLEEIVRSLPPQQEQRFRELLQDPEKAKRMMETPQAKLLLKRLFRSK